MGDFVQRVRRQDGREGTGHADRGRDRVRGGRQRRGHEQPVRLHGLPVGTETHAAVEKTREAYTARIIYENGEAETVGRSPCAARPSRPTPRTSRPCSRTPRSRRPWAARPRTRPTATRSRRRSAATTRTARSTRSRSSAVADHALVLRGRRDPHGRRDLGRLGAGAGVDMDPVLGIGIGSVVGFLIVGILRRLGSWSGRGWRAARPGARPR